MDRMADRGFDLVLGLSCLDFDCRFTVALVPYEDKTTISYIMPFTVDVEMIRLLVVCQVSLNEWIVGQ
jgi:hypothetical protein